MAFLNVKTTLGFLLAILGLGILALDTVSEAAETTTEKLLLYDCKKVMGRIAKKTVKNFGICTKEIKMNSTKEDFDKKINCIVKCAMGKMELLDSSGMVTKETVQLFMDSNVPEDAHELGHMLVEDCLADHGSKLDTNQPFCESYGEFVACMQNVLGEFADKASCNIGFGRRRRR